MANMFFLLAFVTVCLHAATTAGEFSARSFEQNGGISALLERSKRAAMDVDCGTKANTITSVQFHVNCPPGCADKSYRIWGTTYYTSDSNICAAAIHSGRISNSGGAVLVYKISGAPSYTGTTSKGITTINYGSWGSSYVFTDDFDLCGLLSPCHSDAVCSNDDGSYTCRCHNGYTGDGVTCTSNCGKKANTESSSSFELYCPSDCHEETYKVWGTTYYTSDSNICAAAIHSGKISNAGGLVFVYKVVGAPRYTGSVKNGITTINYGSWRSSFVFTSDFDICADMQPCHADATCTINSGSYSCACNDGYYGNGITCTSNCGKKSDSESASAYDVYCPSVCNDEAYTVWGTTYYTSDSNICAAAIHSGRISNAGGLVSVYKIVGAPRYTGSVSNGITTRNYGSWRSSFVFTNEFDICADMQPCHAEATCMNTDGSYTCTCNDGYYGNGLTCTSNCGKKAQSESSSKFNLYCPSVCHEETYRVWGTTYYTSDSNICAAAIHSGVISNTGGLVSVYKVSGAPSYKGSVKNGITTKNYGTWLSSFVFTADFDYCAVVQEQPCHAQATCTNNDGNHTCVCNEGYSGNGVDCTSNCGKKAQSESSSEFNLYCPSSCHEEGYRVWGTTYYTSDSNICAAAIHSGRISSAGGLVSVYKITGAPRYTGTQNNGISTNDYGYWLTSIVFTSDFDICADMQPCHADATCTVNNGAYACACKDGFFGNGLDCASVCVKKADSETSTTFNLNCPSKCKNEAYRVWGTTYYTSDSYICAAAIHSGVISDAGGSVSVYKIIGVPSYKGSVKNGITTKNYGSWRSSYVFTDDFDVCRDMKPCHAQATCINNNGSYNCVCNDGYNGNGIDCKSNCKKKADSETSNAFNVICPSGCQSESYSVWGTTVYTSDSYICAAAIHFGVISGNGGSVNVTKTAGLPNYIGSLSNGITTKKYAAWGSSYTFVDLCL